MYGYPYGEQNERCQCCGKLADVMVGLCADDGRIYHTPLCERCVKECSDVGEGHPVHYPVHSPREAN